MDLKVVLFDLDGTLLPMDQDIFIKKYLTLISARMSRYGYDPQVLPKSIMMGTYKMIKNDGHATNEQVFWDCFCEIYGKEALGDMEHFDEFYVEEFDKLSDFCGYTPKAARVVSKLRQSGMRTALATNPVFPAIATRKRMSWAGLSPSDFELYTTYENSHYCKPNTEYYREIIERLGVLPEECLMVGNDVSDDMVAETIGMNVFLLTDCLINSGDEDISRYKHGNFDELLLYIEEITG